VSRFSPRALIQELRRRRLFNTVALYVVVAWLALQVTELALPALGIPDLAIRYVWIAAFLLVPLVLVFAWRYDLSTGGIQRTAPSGAESANTSLQRVDHWIIGALMGVALIVIGAMGLQISQVGPNAPLQAAGNSIAVLPFEVCTEWSRDQELAVGLSMEVINRLAERNKLRVIARSSSHALADSGLGNKQVARSLGVQHLLTGIVCREGEQLTLAAELLDDQGFIVWSDHFVRGVSQWDQVTERLATQVASDVAARLGDTAPAAAEAPVDPMAYEQLLIGEQFWASNDQRQARAAFERALGYQPDYAKALFYIAILDAGSFLSSHREEGLAKGKPMLEQARDLARLQLEDDDRNADNHLMMGQVSLRLAGVEEELAFRWGHADELDAEMVESLLQAIRDDYAEAERHLRAATALNPSLTEAYIWLAEAIERQGIERRAEGLEILEAGQLRDPFNIAYNGRIAKRWAGRGRYRQAIELMERFKGLPEIPPEAWWWQLEIMQLQNYWDEKCETLIAMLREDPGAFELHDNRWQIWWYVGTLAELGLYDEAAAWKQRLENMPLEDWAREGGLFGYLAATGQVESPASHADVQEAIDSGEIDREIEQLELARHQRAMWHERSVRDDLMLAGLYQLVGRRDEAATLLDTILSQLEAEYAGGIRHWETLYQLSESYARQGRDEEALTMLRKSYDYHGLTSCRDLEEGLYLEVAAASPWPRLAEDPRYRSLCQRIDRDLEQQAQRIREMLASHDVDKLLAVLMKPAAKTN
jgi:TolB-like protein